MALADTVSASLPFSPLPRLSRLVWVLNVKGWGRVTCVPEGFLRVPPLGFLLPATGLDSREAGTSTNCPECAAPLPVPLAPDGPVLRGCVPPRGGAVLWGVGFLAVPWLVLGTTRRRIAVCSMASRSSFGACRVCFATTRQAYSSLPLLGLWCTPPLVETP